MVDSAAQPPRPITNFGGNVRFTPRHFYAPRSEAEVLEILDRHAQGKIRVVASLHSWSEAVVSDDVIVDLRHFDDVAVARDDTGDAWATAGGGVTIKGLLRRLHELSDATLPALGAITEQTIAGAISTGTHGSGRHSISHYIEEIRAAAYDPQTGRATIYTWTAGPELLAARCALGCMGIILSVRFRCRPKYFVAETIRRFRSVDDVLAHEGEFPLQQFVLMPYSWVYYAMQRREAAGPDEQRRSRLAALYRAYALLYIDLGFHLLVKLLAWLRIGSLTRFLYTRVLSHMFKDHKVIDHSHKALILEHEWFRHLEMELFVPARHLARAVEFVRHILLVFANAVDDVPEELAQALASIGMLEELRRGRGSFTFHYPLFFRRVLRDETLISMSCAGGDAAEPYYTISFFSYARPYGTFFPLAEFLAESMSQLFAARPHWGKYFPLDGAEVQRLYPRLHEFREACRRVDPRGVFRNDYTMRVLGFAATADSVERNHDP